MKNTKWIWRVFAVILTLVILAGVGFAGFRIGLMQSGNLPDNMTFGWHSFNGRLAHGFDSDLRGFEHGRSFGGRGGFPFFSPIFGLLKLAVLAGLIWLGYTFFKNSGWRLVNVNANRTTASPSAQSAAEETPSAQDEEKKDEA